MDGLATEGSTGRTSSLLNWIVNSGAHHKMK